MWVSDYFQEQKKLVSLLIIFWGDTGLQIYGGPRPLSHDFKISLSKAVGPVDPSFLVVKKSHFILQQVYKLHKTESSYSQTCLKQPLKKDKPKILISNGSLMKVESIAVLTCIRQ